MGKFLKGRFIFGFAFTMIITSNLFAQQEPLFKKVPLDSLGIRCYELLCRKAGTVHITSSAGLWTIKGHQMEGAMFTMGIGGVKNLRSYMAEDSIRAMAEGPDGMFFYATHDNVIVCSYDLERPNILLPPFYFPPKNQLVGNVLSMYSDNEGDLYIGTSDNFYLIKGGANRKSYKNATYKVVDSMMTILKGELPVTKIFLGSQIGIFSFAQDSLDKNTIWIGTNHGLYSYNKKTGQGKPLIPKDIKIENPLTVTHIELYKLNHLYFSTLEKGMGFYNMIDNLMQFMPYPKTKTTAATIYPIKTFCYKSPDEFFVAVMDSLPAVFNAKGGSYAFIDDSSLHNSANRTNDIKADKMGNLLVVKGGVLYIYKASANKMLNSAIKIDSSLLAPFITNVHFPDGKSIEPNTEGSSRYYKEIRLKYNQNSFYIWYDLAFGTEDSIEFAWKIDGYTLGWVRQVLNLKNDSTQVAMISDLQPGKYVFELKVKAGNEDWRKQQAKMIIIITPPFWQTWWFWTCVISGILLFTYIVVRFRVRSVRKQEREKAKHEKELLEMEARALRAQMNPHFIFNSLNSIKSLIQQNENEKSVSYLTTFSKLIRTLLNNADKKEISLYDEIETCKLYLQLEAMRFDTKFSYAVNVDENIDLKSVQVPALIIQPFIENAIWHGIVPRNSGGTVSLNILHKDGVIEIVIDDDGIGREASQQNKSATGLTHQSKGVNLTQTRLELNNLLQQRQSALEVIDKKDEHGVATGTTVIIKIKEELS